MICLKLNPNEPIWYISGRRIGLRIRLTKKHYLAKLITNIFQSIDRGYDPRNGISKTKQKSSHTVSIWQYLLKGGRLRNWKCEMVKAKCALSLTLNQIKESGSSLILSSSHYQVPCEMKTGLADLSKLSSAILFIFEKWHHLWCSDQLNLFVNGRFTERFPLSHIMALCFVFDACVHQV